MGQILKNFLIGFFAVFFYKNHMYRQRDRDRMLAEIARNTRK